MIEPAYTPADRLWLWWLGDPAHPACVGELSLVQAGRAVALAYDPQWLRSGYGFVFILGGSPHAGGAVG